MEAAAVVEAEVVAAVNPEAVKPTSDVKLFNRWSFDEVSLDDDVPDFPRGGGSSLSREEFAEVRAGVDAEFEAEHRDLKKGKKRRTQKQSQSADDDLGSLFGGGISGKLPRFANKITWKNISPGMRLWGVVAEVNEKDIVISLPGGLRGLVRASESCDHILDDAGKDVDSHFLASMYSIGQLVSCTVLHLDNDKKEKGKPKIWLSLRLSLLHKSLTLEAIQEGMVLSAYVKTIEDHGYILYFGQSSFAGFLPKSSQAENGRSGVNTGSLLQGIVKSIDRTRKVVYLSSELDVSKSVTKELKGISIDLLVPGMMVNARVHSTLENGIMLSFLTYFTGTVDIFHLQKSFPSAKWKDDYLQNKKINARILFIDPSTRAVGLTLNPHLVQNKSPPFLAKAGDIFEHSKVVRVDPGMGLLLEIPTTPIPTPAYVSVSDVTDKEVKKLEKKFKEGSKVRVRILGFKHMEGIVTGILKSSAFEGSVFTHSDVKPGMLVKARVIVVDNFRAVVQFSSGVKALCPLRHMSEYEIIKPRKKFQVGAELQFRVLGCKSKRITVTHKKTLVKSKLAIISSYADATEGLITHGWMTKIESHGCFVHFYNGVQGFAPRSELGLEPGRDPSQVYHIEEVVKCRVTSSAPASRRINLSFLMKPSRVTEDEMVKLGSIVSGVVEQVTPHAIIVRDNAQGNWMGTLSPEHLADHQGLANMMKSLLKPGYAFDQLIVLDIESSNLILSAKHSLVNFAQKLPAEVSQVQPGRVVHGYVCNMIESGCFVRYIGRLTGFAPRGKGMDDRRADLTAAFYVGQSVRSYVLDVCKETGRVTSSLKQSLCSSMDASFIQEYFLLEEKIARLQLSDSKIPEMSWVDYFSIGSRVEGKVKDVKDYGAVVSFEKYPDVIGFITHYQLGGVSLKKDSVVRAVVIDVSKTESLVDLSLKQEFADRIKDEYSETEANTKKRKKAAIKELQVHQIVNAVVEIVKDNYLVLSIPENKFAIGYASTNDYNTQKLPPRQYVNGQSVTATVMILPSPATAGRLLLLLKYIGEATETSSSKRAKKKSGYDVGAFVQAEITEIKPLELKVKFGSGLHGRVHITEASDDNCAEEPFRGLRVGQTLTAAIVSKIKKFEATNKNSQWELSIKPSLLGGNSDYQSLEPKSDDPVVANGYQVGTQVAMLSGSSSPGIQDVDIECENGAPPVLAETEARASILPLEVPLDDLEDLIMDDISREKEHADDDLKTEGKNKQRAKKKAKEEKEQEIRAAEERMLEKDIPRSADEFEKLIRNSPNSSFVWLKYMAFMLSLADVESARAIAERALKTINIREEAEKLNVWVAYFNLENEYGNPPEEAVLKVFHRALQYCDPKKVNLALLGMYERTEQHKSSEDLLKKMVKKFKHSCKIWLRQFQWLLKQNREVQSVVKRAVLCLPNHKHIKFLSQAAILEFKCGVPDRGRSMFEGMLREYPKRTDLWSIYLDQEIRLGDADVIRALFERAISLSLPPKKMKFLFKKYLEYEKSLGDEERIESVKTKAMEYVESTLS